MKLYYLVIGILVATFASLCVVLIFLLREDETVLTPISETVPSAPITAEVKEEVVEEASLISLETIFDQAVKQELVYIDYNTTTWKATDRSSIAKEALRTFDSANWYLEGYNGAEGNFRIAVFLTPNNEQLIVIENISCGPGCMQEVKGYKMMGGRLVLDKTYSDLRALIPDALLEKGNILLSLPQHGTTIDLIEQFSQEDVGGLEWRGGEFVFVGVL